MKKSLKISSECGKQNITVTYGLIKAMLAFQIQVEESRGSDIFIILGSFNTYRKIISESGALQILDESLVLAAGSTNGFIKDNN